MESYGEHLKTARINQGLDFETISRDTTITRQYLEALEEENTVAFPGEPYLVGFLKNYAEYLGLDSAKLISLYHAKMIQESPVPRELTARKRLPILKISLAALFVLLVAGGITTFVVLKKKAAANPDALAAVSKNSISKKYQLSEKPFAGRLYKGDQLIMGSAGGNIILTASQTIGSFGLETPAGVQLVELSEEREIDVDGDSKPELIVYVSDVSKENLDRGVEVRILLKDKANIAIETNDADIPEAEELPKDKQKTVVFEDTRAYPFTLQVTFRGGCLFRWRPDRKEITEDYYESGETITMTASNGIRVWDSDGNTVKFQIIANGRTFDLSVGKAGEVQAMDIKWIKDTDGKYKVVVMDLD